MSDDSPDYERMAQVVRRVIVAPSASLPPADLEPLIRALTAVVVSVRAEERERWRAVRDVVDEQVEDGSIWFTAQTAPEAYLQQELRKLHAAVEGARAAARAAGVRLREVRDAPAANTAPRPVNEAPRSF